MFVRTLVILSLAAITSCADPDPTPVADTSIARDTADIAVFPDASTDPDLGVDTISDVADADAEPDASDGGRDADAAPDVDAGGDPDASSDPDVGPNLVGPEGGRLDFEGGWIDFPPGAVAASTRFDVTREFDLLPEGFEIEGGVWRFSPSPTSFDEPISVCFFVEGIRPANMTVHWSRPLDSDVYDPTISHPVDGAVCGRVHHFSVGFLGRLADPSCDGVDCSPTVAECIGDDAVRPSVLGTCIEGECAYPLAPASPCDDEMICIDGACVPPPRCGDGAINQESETCDGEDLAGLDCRALGFEAGDLACDESCGIDDSDCAGDLCSEVTCDAPPPDACDGNVAVHYDEGECLLGVCGFPETREDCSEIGVCVDGACLPAAESGDLVITEIMANPAGDDAGLEWFEVYNTSDRVIPLSGLSLSDDGSDSLTIRDGPLVEPGAYAVLAEDVGAAPIVDLVWSDSGSMALSNTEDEIEIRVGDTLVDRVAWGSGATPAWTRPNGASMNLDPASISADENDDSGAWCEGLGDYGIPPNQGTPRIANPSCDREPRCGDGFVDDGEECDDGNLVDGDGCQADCSLPECEEPLDCESAPASFCDENTAVTYPTATCETGSCAYIESLEDCTADALTCVEGACLEPPARPGDLVITEFMANVEGDDTGLEWFEIYNQTDVDIPLDGFTIRDDGTNTFSVAGDHVVPATSYFVFAASTAAVPGGVDFAWEETGETYVLANGDDEIVLEWRGLVVDRVTYDSGWGVAPAESLALSGVATDADSNDDPANWCAGTGDYGVAPNVGTPGDPNLPCLVP